MRLNVIGGGPLATSPRNISVVKKGDGSEILIKMLMRAITESIIKARPRALKNNGEV